VLPVIDRTFSRTFSQETGNLPDNKKSYALLVDSYVRDLFSTGMILQRLDYEVYVANSGEDGLRIIEAATPAIVITELSLQNMSGLEFLLHLKHTPETKAVPVIIHTSSEDPKQEEHCRASGCAAFLRKPAEINELYSAIQHATENLPRQFIRLRTLLPVRVGGHTSPDAANSIEFVSEISENGLFVRTLHPRPVNAVLPVNLIIHSMAVKVKAVVLYSVTMKPGLFTEPGMGMKFIEISDTHQELLRNFIKGQIMKDITTNQ
jgi:two-component system cell cycle response regulator DivK